MKPHETTAQCVERKLGRKLRLIRVARGEEPADIVFKNATYLNVFSNDFCHGDIAVSDGLIAGIGSYHGSKEVDVSGSFVCPGLIDAHIHLESSLVSPAEFARAVIRHGTTTVITDPHEIANVMGVDGIRYMLEATEGLPVDVHFMLPSCVPATPLDESGCTLDYQAIDDLYDHSRVLGLAEMMNYVGVINGDPAVISKILASQAHHKKSMATHPISPAPISTPISPPASIPITSAAPARMRWKAAARPVHHDTGGHRRPESAGTPAAAQSAVLLPVHVCHR